MASEPQVQGDLPALIRRPVIFIPPVIPDEWSHSFAQAVGTVANAPDLVNSIQQRYVQSGNAAEFKAYEDSFYQAKDEEAAARVIVRMKNRAKELGLDDQTLVHLDLADKVNILQTEGEAMRQQQKQALPALFDKSLTNVEEVEKSDNHDQYDVDFTSYMSKRAVDYSVQAAADQKALENDYQANFLEGDRVEPTGIPGTIAEFSAQIGASFIPFNTISEVHSIAKAMGLNYDKNGNLVEGEYNLNVGEIRARLRENYLKATPEQKKAQWEIFKKASKSMLSDLDARDLATFIFNPNAGPPPDDRVDYLMNAVMPWVDSVFALQGVKSVAKWGIQGIMRTAAPALKAAIPINKQATRAMVAEAMIDASKAVNPVLKSKTYEKWGLSEAQVGVSQIPKEVNALNQVADFPDNLADEVARIRSIQEDLSANIQRSSTLDLGETNVAAVIDREAKDIEETFKGQLRPGMSTIKVKSDGSGLEFGVTLGKNDLTGFPTLREAASQAEEHVLNGERVTLLESDGKIVTPILTGKEAVEELMAIQRGQAKDRAGSYYVRIHKDYTYRPIDKMLFGDDPVIAPTWMGRAANYLLHPSNRFTEEFYAPYLKNYLTEQSTKAYMGRMTAPIRAMSNSTQRRINDMYEWSYQFARENKAEPTAEDLWNKFDYAATSEEVRGFYLMKQFYKTSHEIQNKRLFTDWKARGFKTVRSKNAEGGTYHGLPKTRESLGKKDLTVYDPELQSLRVLDTKALDDLYGNGGQVLRTELAMRGTKNRNAFSYNIMVAGDKSAYEVVPLISNPLRYIPGYWPRMYKDNYYIRRQVTKATIDGQSNPEFTQVVAVAGTKREAEKFVEYANGRSKKGAVYSVQDDKRLSLNDSIANDLEFLRTEGRLFFDSRKPHLRDVHGLRADIYDPINMLSRSTGAISRQIAVEDLIKGLKTAWSGRYSKLISHDVDTAKSSAISLELNQKLTSGGGEQVNKALLSWNYIQVMEGSVNQGSQFFRKASIGAAEWLGTLLKKAPAAKDPANWVIRNGGNLSPVEGLKNFAFHYFITMRPLRQLLVQSSQHLFLSALDPTYGLGRLQKDIPLLILGLKGRARAQVFGPKEEAFFSGSNAKLMGLSKPEYEVLSKQFDRSGLVQTIDVHSIAGTSMSTVEDLPMSVAGDMAQRAANVITAAPVRNFFRKAGFETGETANLAGSYLMALRLFRNSRPEIKSLMQITEPEWADIGFKASNYAMAMNRAGAANYQYSVLSLPLQFLQYSHKTMLVGAKAVLGKKLGSAFTTREAQKMMAGQIILFGGAGFGVKEYVSGWLGKSGFSDLQGTEVEDIIAGGTLDWTLDKALQTVSNDPQLNLAFDSLLAPGGSVAQTGRQFWEAAMEQPIYQALAGPATEAGGQVMKFVHLAEVMRGDGITDDESLKEGLLLVGGAAYGGAWANDLWKARLAQKTGYWVTQNGQLSGVEAQWEAVVAKGLFGINSQNVIDNYNLMESEFQHKKDLDDIAKEYSNAVNQLSLAFHENPYSYEDLTKRLRQAAAGFKGGLEPEEWQYVVKQFYREQQNAQETKASALDIIGRDITYGVPADEAMLAKLKSSQLLRNHPQKDEFIKLMESAVEEANQQAAEPIDIFGLDQNNLDETDKALKEMSK